MRSLSRTITSLSLLVALADGDRSALEQLTPLVYGELHRLARCYMRGERPDHTLEPTALVNEAYLRLMDWKNVRWRNRAHFFGVSAQLMRRILVDFARARGSKKRMGDAVDGPHAEGARLRIEKEADVVAVDDALSGLAAFDKLKGDIVELRFFGGLTVDETAEVLGISASTVSANGAWPERGSAPNYPAHNSPDSFCFPFPP